MGLCGSDDEGEVPEYDELPRGLSWRMRFGKKKVEQYSGRTVIRLGNNRIIKRGGQSTEYEALKLVDRHTSVPIPKVLGVYHLREGVLVEYEAMPGRTLDSAWHHLSAPQKRKIIEDLGRFVDQLRKIEAPKHVVVGSATFGAAFDSRFGTGKIGPFYTVAAFHDYVRRGHPPQDFPEEHLHRCHTRSPEYELKFTHASLCPANVLVDESGRISCIIGWESAGWYPEYWEYTQMHRATSKELSDWWEAMQKVVPRYDDEVVADEALRSRFSGSVYDSPRSVRAPSPSASELERERREIDDKNTESTSG